MELDVELDYRTKRYKIFLYKIMQNKMFRFETIPGS